MPSAKDPILKELKSISARLARIEKVVLLEEEQEKEVLADEEHVIDELARLEQLEEEIKRDVAPHPLKRITYRDFTKGIIGSFFGIVGHFAFFYGSKIAHEISTLRASALILTSFAILILFMYFSGFRKVAKERRHHYLMWRVLVIFLTAHAVIAFVLTLFGVVDFGMTLTEVYKNVAAVSILAVMGAATADLIGGDGE